MRPKRLAISPAPVDATRANRPKFVFVGFLVIAAVLALEQPAHLLGILPWLLLLACPLMHFFMHHGHGGHRGHRDAGKDSDAQ